MDLRNKRVIVVGLGKSGLEAGLLLKKEGASVRVTDAGDTGDIRKNAGSLEKSGIAVEIGGHTGRFLKGAELLVVSPGVAKSAMPVSYAEKEKIPIISELELGYRFTKGPIVAVTGTNGKSTVVTLLGEILKEANMPVNVCGNIGNPLSGEIANIGKDTRVILEVSSFQLEHVVLFRPKISVILNITSDHLDGYNNFEEYRDFKARVFENQKGDDTVILNYADEAIKKLADTKKISAKILYFNNKKAHRGKHNLENIAAASMAAEVLGIDGAAIRRAIENFTPLSHRFEKIADIGGIEFIDDSKATNVHSTYRALLSLDRPTILIAGGKDKNLSYGQILPAVKKIVKKIILIGETKSKMRNIFKDCVALEECASLEDAVCSAKRCASGGDIILLSPMCSSFDMFRDYKERGEVFRRAVWKLKEEPCFP